jgi:hypothetical protein
MIHPGHRWTWALKLRFLETLAETGNVRESCRAVAFSREAAYKLRRRDPLFAQGWNLARRAAHARRCSILLGE